MLANLKFYILFLESLLAQSAFMLWSWKINSIFIWEVENAESKNVYNTNNDSMLINYNRY